MKFPYTTACLPLTRSTLRFGLVLLVAAVFAQTGGAEARRPNILFILADDQAPWDLRVYNPVSTLDTPHLDQLAAAPPQLAAPASLRYHALGCAG